MRRQLSLLLVLLIITAAATSAPLTLRAQGCSDAAELVEQTLDPASGLVAPDATFTVSWTLRNSGDCTWDRNYRLVFVRGERMDSLRTARLRSQVEPGEMLTLTLDLTAPGEPDSYSGVWQLRNPDGDRFGPELELEIQVTEEAVATTDVVLPEVLAFGGMGAGGDEEALGYCLDGDTLPETPTLVVDYEALQYRYTVLYVCSLSEGAAITVEVTNPEGISFQRAYVEDAPVTYTHYTGDEEEGIDYTGTVLTVSLAWIKQAPSGDWWVTVTGDEIEAEALLTVPPPMQGFDDSDYPQLDNWPLTPIDPFIGAEGCHYTYTPGQEIMVGGQYLPASTTLHLGIYQSRFYNGYLVGHEVVQSDEQGAFTHLIIAPESGEYHLVVVERVESEAFTEDGAQFEFTFGGEESAFSCFTVVPEKTAETEDELPWRLAFASGSPGLSDILVFDAPTGDGYYLTSAYGQCDSSEPAWWPGGEWVLYQSNCLRVEGEEFPELTLAEDYDLYARQVDPTYTLPEEETLSRLTFTPEVDETEPDASLDGLIVYRQTPAGSSLEESGELWLLNIFDDTSTPLGLYGRAPTWSPDGSRIAFMSDIEGSWQIYVYDWNEGELWLASEGCTTHCRFPAWSPDGEQLIYHASVSLQDFTPEGLWMVAAEGGTPRRWLSGEYARPTWSAQGWVAFQGPGGIYHAAPSRRPTVDRYLYSDPEVATHWAPVWSR